MNNYKITYRGYDECIITTRIVQAVSDIQASILAKMIMIEYSYYEVYEI